MGDQGVRFGLTLPQRGLLFDVIDADGLLDLARQADANSRFDSVWVGDSLFAKPRPDSTALLGTLAGVTSRVKLGVGCMASFPVRDPLVFAYQWATLDVISHGRMVLAACTGIVQGGASQEEGRPWNVKDSERASRMAENIQICRQLWTGETTSYDGRFTQFSDVRVAPAPVQQPCPIWIAANPRPIPERPESTRRPLQRVARIADGWMTVGMFPGAFGILWGELRELLIQDGRDPDAFPTIAYHNINICDDADAGFAETKRFLDHYYGPVFGEPVIRSWTALGSPEACVEHLERLKDAGAKNITLRITSWDQKGQLQRLVDEVLPHL